MKFETHARRSGRTTRMMEEAKRLDAEGKAVYVVFSTQTECNYWRDFVTGTGIKLETPASIGGYRMVEEVIVKGRLPGQWPNVVTLVDHYCVLYILQRYEPFISAFYRWDKNKEDGIQEIR